MYAMGSIIGQRMVLRLKDKRSPQHTEELDMARWTAGVDLSDSDENHGDPQTIFDPVQSN